VEAARLPALLAVGERAAARAVSFRVAFERLGGGSYALCWLAPALVPDALRELHGALVDELRAENFATEQRMFRPHVTLARDGTVRARRGEVRPIAWEVTELALVASTTAAGGSRYERMATWPLGGARRADVSR
jgi:RNA 2',3'-cyclic 3'-phosphodiesterase